MSMNAASRTMFRLSPIAYLVAVAYSVPVLAADEGGEKDRMLPQISVTAEAAKNAPTEKTNEYTVRQSDSATRLNLSLRETPQTVSVITRSVLDDFKLNSVNDALAFSSGVVVERVETDRTYYTARGFDITNFQTDGIGMPFAYGNVNGDIDTAIYDRVEAVYGANSLMSATGFPSATINFVRKRPTAQHRSAAGLTAGSWNTYRIDADISNSLVESGRVRGRLVFAREDGNSYLDRYKRDKTVFYSVVEADLTNATTFAAGYHNQNNNTNGGMWGSLPMFFADGTRTNYDVSTSTSANWSRWNSYRRTAFAELIHQFNDDWQGKAVLTQSTFGNDGDLFYVYGAPDRTTGLGLFAYPSQYAMTNKQAQADVFVTGKFELSGRKHDLTFGANTSRSKLTDISNYGRGIGTALPPFGDDWDGNYPLPIFDAAVDGSNFTFRQKSLFAAARINASDRLKVIAGVRSVRSESEGISYGVARASSASQATPYVGVIYDLTETLSAYGSYTDIFNPQYQVDASGAPLKPVDGKSEEIGLKGEFLDQKLNASLALFRTEQNNFAEAAGTSGGRTFYRGIDANSEGFQVDVTGQLTSQLQASAGFTQVSIRDDQGIDARTYAPRRLLRLATIYKVATVDGLRVGANVSWQGDAYAMSGANELRQEAYALVGLMARYDLSKNLTVSANLNNLTNEKHLASLYWGSFGQGFYGAPRNGSVSLTWKY